MSGWYLNGKESLLARTIAADAGVYAIGVNNEYAFDESHTDLTFITPHILLPETALAGVTFSAGTLRAANQQWLAAGAGIADRSLLLTGLIICFKKLAARTLLAYIDSASIGLPQTLAGTDITAHFNALGILKL